MNIYLVLGAGTVLVLLAAAFVRAADARRGAFEQDVERVRSGSARQTFVRMQAEFRARVTRMLINRDNYRRSSRRWRARQTLLVKKIWPKQPPKPGYLILMGILTVFWVAMFLLIRSADIYILKSLGQTQPVAAVLGTIVAASYTLLGWFITGLLGMHSVLPPGFRMSRTVRTLVVGLLLVVTIGISLVMMNVAPYRSQSTVGKDLDTATKVLAEVRATDPVDPVQEAAQAAQVAALTRKLETAQRFDALTITVMPVMEILTSGALITVLEAGVVGIAGLVAAGYGRAAERSDRRIEIAGQAQHAYAMRVVEAAGQEPEDYDRALQQIESASSPGGPAQPPVAGGPAQPPVAGGPAQPPVVGGPAQPPVVGGPAQPPVTGGSYPYSPPSGPEDSGSDPYRLF